MEKKNLSIPLSIITAGIIIAGAVYFSRSDNIIDTGRQNSSTSGVGDQKQESNWPKEVSADDHILGNPDAPIKIIEFSDTECPFCQRLHPTLKKVMENYGKNGQVAWVYRHFPIDSRHSRARKEAEATECAAELGGEQKFWEYLDRLFEITPSNNGLDPAKLPEIAVYIGLDETKFEKCLVSGKYAEKVQNDFEDGVQTGVSGTPYSVMIAGGLSAQAGKKETLNGVRPTDKETYEIFEATIKKLLE